MMSAESWWSHNFFVKNVDQPVSAYYYFFSSLSLKFIFYLFGVGICYNMKKQKHVWLFSMLIYNAIYIDFKYMYSF